MQCYVHKAIKRVTIRHHYIEQEGQTLPKQYRYKINMDNSPEYIAQEGEDPMLALQQLVRSLENRIIATENKNERTEEALKETNEKLRKSIKDQDEMRRKLDQTEEKLKRSKETEHEVRTHLRNTEADLKKMKEELEDSEKARTAMREEIGKTRVDLESVYKKLEATEHDLESVYKKFESTEHNLRKEKKRHAACRIIFSQEKLTAKEMVECIRQLEDPNKVAACLATGRCGEAEEATQLKAVFELNSDVPFESLWSAYEKRYLFKYIVDKVKDNMDLIFVLWAGALGVYFLYSYGSLYPAYYMVKSMCPKCISYIINCCPFAMKPVVFDTACKIAYGAACFKTYFRLRGPPLDE